MDNIQQIYYINLDHRVDRQVQFEEWLQESSFPESKITRISATHTPGKGFLGATLSHIKALETFINSEYTLCCIYEDDYNPVDVVNYWSNIETIFQNNIEFDMVLLSYNQLEAESTDYSFLKKVSMSLTASGYMITKDFATHLLENMKDAYTKQKEYVEIHKTKNCEYCLDTYWNKLFSDFKVFAYYPRLGKQIDSYSDIENEYISYNA